MNSVPDPTDPAPPIYFSQTSFEVGKKPWRGFLWKEEVTSRESGAGHCPGGKSSESAEATSFKKKLCEDVMGFPVVGW